MGCCFSSDDNKDPEFPEPDERTRLLDPDLGSASAPPLSSHGDQYSGGGDQGDEQSVMARILHQNAREVIDVASADNAIEEQEYQDRARQYNNRLKMVLSGRRGSSKRTLPSITNPVAMLAAAPVSPSEIQLICNISEKMSKAMREVRIQHREDLVVSFGVPMP